MARFRLVRLGEHKVRKVRGNTADAHDAADVFLYRDSSIAPLLDMKRRFKAVLDVLDAMIRYGISLARSVELTAQWDRSLAFGPLYPVTLGDLNVFRGVGVGEFHRIVSDVHRRLSDFIHAKLIFEVEGWLPLLPEFELPRLTGHTLADVVLRKSATAGSLDGWGWRELKVLPVAWYDELARTMVEDTGFGLMVCWMLTLL